MFTIFNSMKTVLIFAIWSVNNEEDYHEGK